MLGVFHEGNNKLSRPGTLFSGKRGGNYPAPKLQTFPHPASILTKNFLFPLANPIFFVSLPSPSREKTAWPEKAHSSLCSLIRETGHFTRRRNNQNGKFNAFVAVDENCSTNPDSFARKVREAIKSHFSKEELDRIDFLRNILEKDYTNYPIELQYLESSELASKILEVADCILSYSAKDNKELNVTFNKFPKPQNINASNTYSQCAAMPAQRPPMVCAPMALPMSLR